MVVVAVVVFVVVIVNTVTGAAAVLLVLKEKSVYRNLEGFESRHEESSDRELT